MKKSFAFISLFLMLGVTTLFAEVSVKKLPDGNAEVRFFYGNPRAEEVLVAGTFTNWQAAAEAMTKTETGFELTKVFKPTEELSYKFIVDGNWTTDLKAPEFIDDGFGGKNGKVAIADLLGGDGDGAPRAKINFISWTMIGTQSKFTTQSYSDPKKKGLDLDNVTIGMKSYNKFAGNFLPNCPVYVEIALAETEIDDAFGSNNPIYLVKKDKFGRHEIVVKDSFAKLFNDLFTNPVAYFARSTDNKGGDAGPGTNPFLGHLKFGFNSPYVNFVTGFNYAKPDVRSAILWTTVSGSWDAGYQHVGGFSVFSLGDKPVAAIQELTGLKFDIGFAPNKTADRKGKKYGYWGWFGVSNDYFAVDLQSNGMYDGETLFSKPVEHDFIIGGKSADIKLAEASKLNVAAQVLVATHQKKFTPTEKGSTDYFGYSTDVFYRDGEFGLGNIAGQLKVGFDQGYNEYRGSFQDSIGVEASYRMRGYQASMLYVRENHDDGTFDLSEMLGALNSQNIDIAVTGTLLEKKIELGLEAGLSMPLTKTSKFTEDDYWKASDAEGWYKDRCGSKMAPMFGEEKPELTLTPSATFDIAGFVDNPFGGTIGVYGEMNANFGGEKYDVSESYFRFKKAGITYTYAAEDKDAFLKGINVYYGLDNGNAKRLFNTLVAECMLPYDINVVLGGGIKTINNNAAGKTLNAAENNMFGAVVGISKKLSSMKKPIVYAQFVYNMDTFKGFGDGQEGLALSGANVSGRWDSSAKKGSISAVDFYDGKAALRVGIRWDI